MKKDSNQPTSFLIDLISDQHKELRRELMEQWSKQHPPESTDRMPMTETEAHFLAMLNQENLTVAESARRMNISRQGAHKCAKQLIERGYISLSEIEGNMKEKPLHLTQKGEEYTREMDQLKATIDQRILKKIGQEAYDYLLHAMDSRWI